MYNLFYINHHSFVDIYVYTTSVSFLCPRDHDVLSWCRLLDIVREKFRKGMQCDNSKVRVCVEKRVTRMHHCTLYARHMR